MSDFATIANAVIAALPSADAVATAAASSDAIDKGLLHVGKGLVYGLAAAGCGVGIGIVAAAALNGSARQPEMSGKLQTMMFLGVGFIEALALIGLVAIFLV